MGNGHRGARRPRFSWYIFPSVASQCSLQRCTYGIRRCTQQIEPFSILEIIEDLLRSTRRIVGRVSWNQKDQLPKQ